ncbi:gamma-glutamyltransferase family protein [Ottowia sp. VDI28]|uniref:gamma-glutamyltransferase family protein n=1 Tax=Ottowia sp. VDI28 TaxID=3133968 RepID=UPI003C305FE5
MLTRKFWPLAPLTAAVILLASCGGDGGDDNTRDLIVDNDPTSCTIRGDGGSSIVVGSGVAGDPAAPEAASGYRLGLTAKTSSRYMAVANTPLAVKAGCDILKSGGTAVDAAVAMQAVLGLVEPQSSTIAGSAFMVYYDAKTKKVMAYDGRETAPAAATGYYLKRQDQADPNSPTPVPSARRSGRSIGVPGVLRMLEMAQKEHGKLAWNGLFDYGVKLSTDGFQIPGRLGAAIKSNANSLALDANAMATYFHADGTPRETGETMTNLPYANTLKAIAEKGADALHTGEIAKAIVEKAAQSVGDDPAKTPITPSLMTMSDLANYQPKKREPVCVNYRSTYHICSMAPPSSGGIAIAQSFGILGQFALPQYGPANPSNEGGVPSVMGVHLVSEAERLAYADRDKYVADTDFIPLPGQGFSTMLNPDYLKARASLINLDQSMGTAVAGDLGDVPLGIDKTVEHGTTHLSVVDAYGNVASMTTTVESSMGSFHMVDGFLLTNQLTDFSADPADASGTPIANRVAPGKRPRSTMAPTLVFRGDQPGDFVMATGSPGGGSIIQYVVKTVVGALDWGLDAQQATSLVIFGASNSATTSVDGSNTSLDLTALIAGLEAKGHRVNNGAQSSGVATIMRVTQGNKTVLQGGADPRREGIVLGDGAL